MSEDKIGPYGLSDSGCILMLKGFRCDLHIHTCLSPCADLDMYPTALVEKSLASGLDVIGICDHNASENVQYVIEASRGKPVHVFPGMEITSREEVHVIALFETSIICYRFRRSYITPFPVPTGKRYSGVRQS